MRVLAVSSFTLPLFVLSIVPSGWAFEKVLDRATSTDANWNAGASCTIQYWNACVGWTWTWTSWSPQDRIGVNFHSCRPNLESVDVFTRFTNGVPVCPGYGFTPHLEAFAADANGCATGPVLGTVTFLPDGTTQNVAFAAPVAVPPSFVALIRMGSGGNGTVRYGTDYDAQGPTGPQGCGLCFPTTRATRSFYYGTPSSPLCPGSRVEGPVCDVEWRWNPHMSGGVNIEESSWSQLKNMYR